jgi:segregation and condensation protein B
MIPRMSADAKQPEPAEGRFSLHRLSAAFARLTGTVEAPEPSDPNVAPAPDEVPSHSATADRVVLSPRMIVEGMLFVGQTDGQPLTNRAMAAHIRDVSPQEVDAVIAELNEIYDRNRCCYTIVSEGAGYRLQLRPEHEALRQRLSGRTKQAKLTPQAIEVLSVVAYRQPVSADDVTKVRGSRSDALLNQLIRRGLLQLERIETASKPVYRTTDRFNQLLNIKSPAELPRSDDLDDN